MRRQFFSVERVLGLLISLVNQLYDATSSWVSFVAITLIIIKEFQLSFAFNGVSSGDFASRSLKNQS